MAQRELFAEDDADDVKTDVVPIRAGVTGIVASRGHDAAFLLGIDSAVGRSVVGAGPGLHLDEHNDVPFTGHDVDLAAEVGSAVVPGQDGQAGLPQIAVSKVFTATSQRRVGG